MIQGVWVGKGLFGGGQIRLGWWGNCWGGGQIYVHAADLLLQSGRVGGATQDHGRRTVIRDTGQDDLECARLLGLFKHHERRHIGARTPPDVVGHQGTAAVGVQAKAAPRTPADPPH